ncbi:unnamed protein product [Calypogeia fissa]
MQGHESPTATPVRKSNLEPAVGPASMTKICSYVVSGISFDHVETPTPKYFKQFLKNVSSPKKTGSNDNEDGGQRTSHTVLVNLFLEFLHHVGSPSLPVPHIILESQEVSAEFHNTTPFVVAETQQSTQSPKFQKLLAMVDSRIGKSEKGKGPQ